MRPARAGRYLRPFSRGASADLRAAGRSGIARVPPESRWRGARGRRAARTRSIGALRVAPPALCAGKTTRAAGQLEQSRLGTHRGRLERHDGTRLAGHDARRARRRDCTRASRQRGARGRAPRASSRRQARSVARGTGAHRAFAGLARRDHAVVAGAACVDLVDLDRLGDGTGLRQTHLGCAGLRPAGRISPAPRPGTRSRWRSPAGARARGSGRRPADAPRGLRKKSGRGHRHHRRPGR